MVWRNPLVKGPTYEEVANEEAEREATYAEMAPELDALEIQHKAQRAAAEGYNTYQNFTINFKPEDFYVVWSVKVLENWKALLSTDRVNNGVYIEVTYNNDKLETYVDVYYKHANIVL
jgi:hypothetical protein